MKIQELIAKLKEIEKRNPEAEVRLCCSDYNKCQTQEYEFEVIEICHADGKITVELLVEVELVLEFRNLYKEDWVELNYMKKHSKKEPGTNSYTIV
jgi:hypothetical protein